MEIIWGTILLVLSSIAYFGQLITTFWPEAATKLGLAESEADIDPVFFADIRAEAIWDTAILWTLPVAAILLIIGNPAWALFGLVGGGMYLYFAGRGMIARREMQRKNIKIGSSKNLQTFTVFLLIWGTMAIITIIIAISDLPLT